MNKSMIGRARKQYNITVEIFLFFSYEYTTIKFLREIFEESKLCCDKRLTEIQIILIISLLLMKLVKYVFLST